METSRLEPENYLATMTEYQHMDDGRTGKMESLGPQGYHWATTLNPETLPSNEIIFIA